MTILGVVAALTVPSIVHNNQTRINKTRLKKAMATYDRAISQMSVVNRLNNKVLFKEWAKENDCDNAVSYFNIVNSTRNGCKFRTSDGIWWDVSEIDRTIVSFKEQNLISQKAKDYDDKDAFVLVASFDDTQGILRIDDLGYETNNPIDFSNVFVAKLYEFISGISSDISKFDICKAMSADTCTITVGGKEYVYSKQTLLTDYTKTYRNIQSTAKAGDVYVSLEGKLEEYEAKSDETCRASSLGYDTCKQNGDYYEAAKIKCNKQGASLANLAELLSLYDSTKNSTKIIYNGTPYWSIIEDNDNTRAQLRVQWNTISVYSKSNSNPEVLCIK